MEATPAIAPDMTLGSRLAVARHRTGLGLREVAARVPGVSMSALAKWEHDEREPGLYRIAKLAKFYGVDIRWLIEGIDTSEVRTFADVHPGQLALIDIPRPAPAAAHSVEMHAAAA